MLRSKVSALASRMRNKLKTDLVTAAIDEFIQVIQDLVPPEYKKHMIDRLNKSSQIEQSRDSNEVRREGTANLDDNAVSEKFRKIAEKFLLQEEKKAE